MNPLQHPQQAAQEVDNIICLIDREIAVWEKADRYDGVIALKALKSIIHADAGLRDETLEFVREEIRSARSIQREGGVNFWLVPDAVMLKIRSVLGPIRALTKVEDTE